MNETIQHILDVFHKNEFDSYPRETFDQVLLHYEELKPHLVAILENILKEPEFDPDQEWSFAPTFSLMLLAHFKNTDAHDIVIRIMSMRKEIVDSIFGDMITEDFPRILFQTCGGKYDQIKELALNEKAYEYVRGSAIRALVLGIYFGSLPRSEALEFFSRILSGDETDENSHFLDVAVTVNKFPLLSQVYDRSCIAPGLETVSFPAE